MVWLGPSKDAIWGRVRVSGFEGLREGLKLGGNGDGGERDEIKRGLLQTGAIWAARSVPDAEVPIMRTFCS